MGYIKLMDDVRLVLRSKTSPQYLLSPSLIEIRRTSLLFIYLFMFCSLFLTSSFTECSNFRLPERTDSFIFRILAKTSQTRTVIATRYSRSRKVRVFLLVVPVLLPFNSQDFLPTVHRLKSLGKHTFPLILLFNSFNLVPV